MATMVDEENTLLEPPRGRDSSSRETLIRSLRSTLGSTLGRRQLMHRGVDHSQSIWRWLGIPIFLLILVDKMKGACGHIALSGGMWWSHMMRMFIPSSNVIQMSKQTYGTIEGGDP